MNIRCDSILILIILLLSSYYSFSQNTEPELKWTLLESKQYQVTVLKFDNNYDSMVQTLIDKKMKVFGEQELILKTTGELIVVGYGDTTRTKFDIRGNILQLGNRFYTIILLSDDYLEIESTDLIINKRSKFINTDLIKNKSLDDLRSLYTLDKIDSLSMGFTQQKIVLSSRKDIFSKLDKEAEYIGKYSINSHFKRTFKDRLIDDISYIGPTDWEYFEIVVEKDGTVEFPYAKHSSVDPDNYEKVRSAIKTMSGQWKPALKNGIPVASFVEISLKFKV